MWWPTVLEFTCKTPHCLYNCFHLLAAVIKIFLIDITIPRLFTAGRIFGGYYIVKYRWLFPLWPLRRKEARLFGQREMDLFPWQDDFPRSTIAPDVSYENFRQRVTTPRLPAIVFLSLFSVEGKEAALDGTSVASR